MSKPYGYWKLQKETLAYYAKTKNAKEIAEIYGVSHGAMMTALGNVGIVCHKHYKVSEKTIERVKQVKKLLKEKTIPQIAKELNMRAPTLRAFMNRHSIEPEKRYHCSTYWNSRRDELTEYCKTMSTVLIAKKIGLSVSRTRKILCSFGLSAFHPVVKSEKKQSKSSPKKQVVKKTTEPKQTKTFSFEKKPVHIVFPESVKIQVIKPNKCNDWRNAMARAPLSSFKETSWRY